METLNSDTGLSGRLVITKTNEFGEQEIIEVPNLVVAAGKGNIAARMAGNTAAVMSHMAIGTGNTAATSSDTTLSTEIARQALGTAGGTPSSNTVTYSATFSAGTGTGTLVEAGIFNDGSSGTMLCRTVFDPVNKAAGDTLAISWVVSIV